MKFVETQDLPQDVIAQIVGECSARSIQVDDSLPLWRGLFIDQFIEARDRVKRELRRDCFYYLHTNLN